MRKTPTHTEKKMVYSIRSLKNGTGSVLIGASLVLLAMATPTISADESTPTTNANNSETTTALAQPLTDTATSTGKKESDFSSPNNASASLEKEEKPATEATTPVASPADPAPQTGQDRSSETTTSVSMSKNFLKKTRMLKDYGLGTMLKNHLKIGQTEPCPSRMPKKMTTAIT